MISIRKRLLAWMLAGLSLLWLAVGLVVNITVRNSLEGKFDAELRTIAAEVHYVLPEGGRPLTAKPASFWLEFFLKDSGLYFQVWDQDLLFSDRSPNLGEQALPRPEAFTETPRVWNFRSATGEKLRGIAQQFVLAGDRTINVVVARNRDRLVGSIRMLLAATALVGLLMIPMLYLTVRVAVRQGLKPMHAFDARVAAFGVNALQERLETSGIPDELLPISRRLNALMDRLEAGVARERRLNADLAHELRTPIAELRTMAEVALAWPDQINVDRYRDVLDAARHMQAVVEGMLVLARCDQGGERPPAQTINVADLVRSCWQPHATEAAARQLRFDSQIPSDVVVLSNPDLLQIIMGNLIANAVAYSPPGGTVRVAGAGAGAQFRLLVANPAGDLSQADMPHLFERFWRRDAARSASQHAGLGLALAKSCADSLSLDLTARLDEASQVIAFQLCSRSAAELILGSCSGNLPSDILGQVERGHHEIAPPRKS